MGFIVRALNGLQVFLVILGFVMMINNIVATAQFYAPSEVYDESMIFSLLLDAVQVLVFFGGAIAVGTLRGSLEK